MMNTLRRRAGIAAGIAALSITLAACGSDDADVAEPTEDSMADDDMADDDMADDEMDDMDDMESALTLMPVGDACSAIDPEGEGSSEGMADDPVATAASNNPLLSTLVTAVSEAGLVDTLNGVEGATVFAPINDAFAAIPEEDLNAILADQELLTTILTLHVVGENNELADLESAGTVTSLEGSELTLDFSGGELLTVTAGGSTAQVICGNVQTANATVFLIDTVLTPAG